MSKKVINDSTLEAIADAIRDKNGSSDTYTPLDMPQAIEDIPTGGDTIDELLLSKTLTEYTNETFDSSIPDYAFAACSHLTKVHLPNASGIGVRSFDGCSGLSNIDFTSVTNIGNYAFSSAFVANSVVSFPAATTIGQNSFEKVNCKSVLLPELLSIGANSFQNSKIENISIPKVTSVGNFAFEQCRNLESITFKKTVTLSNSLFRYNTALTSVVFEGHVNSLGNQVFLGCSNCLLYDFSNCTSVPTIGTNSFGSINANAHIVVPDDLYNDWIAATNWTVNAANIIKKSDYDAL